MHTKAAIIEVALTGPRQTFRSCSRNWYSRVMVASHAEHGYEKKMQKHSFCTPLQQVTPKSVITGKNICTVVVFVLAKDIPVKNKQY